MSVKEALMFDALRQAIKYKLSNYTSFYIDRLEDLASIHNYQENEVNYGDLWKNLIELGLFEYNIPIKSGGFELGESVISMACEELGRIIFQYPFIETVTVLELLNQKQIHFEIIKSTLLGENRFEIIMLSDKEYEEEENKDLTVTSLGTHLISGTGLLGNLILLVNKKVYLLPTTTQEISIEDSRTITGLKKKVKLNNLTLTQEHLITNEVEEFNQFLSKLRARQASFLIGQASGAMQSTIKYINKRTQFGKKLIDHQGLSFRLATLFAELEALKLKVRVTAIAEEHARNSIQISNETLALTAELALNISRESLHFHGAFGMTNLSIIQKYYKEIAYQSVKYGVPDVLLLEAAKIRMEKR